MYNTVDNPIFPTTGQALHAVDRPRGARRQHELLSSRASKASGTSQQNKPHVARLARAGRVHPAVRQHAATLPIFERLFLGGEYSVRGFDIRSIGPRDPVTGLVLGGNKSLLFNAEYLIHDRRAGAAGAVLRCRPGARLGRAVRAGRKTDQPVIPPPLAPSIVSDPLVSVAQRSERAVAAIRPT